jgi:hypothetical protein
MANEVDFSMPVDGEGEDVEQSPPPDAAAEDADDLETPDSGGDVDARKRRGWRDYTVAAIAIVLTFAVTITAAAAEVTAIIVEVTAVVVVIAATAVVAHMQHIVCAKPPNGQTQFSVAPKGKSTIGIIMHSVSNFSLFWIAHLYHPNLLPISTIAAAIAIAAQSWRNSVLRSLPTS